MMLSIVACPVISFNKRPCLLHLDSSRPRVKKVLARFNLRKREEKGLRVPELPEVENLVRGVREELLGRSFKALSFLRPDLREPIPAGRLREILVGRKVLDVTRRGKYMLIHTDKGALGVHLGMSGRFLAALKADKLLPHTHAIFEMDSQKQYRFIDPRRFGRLFSVERSEIHTHPFLAKLGIEPLKDGIDLGQHLFAESRRRKQAVKIFLMDGEVVVGVGNIYASESLWRAKIHPERRAHELKRSEYQRLGREIVNVLTDAIHAGGTTFRDYRDKDGNPGYFQTKLAVYGRDTKDCWRCASKIIKVTQAARSTYFCPVCQK